MGASARGKWGRIGAIGTVAGLTAVTALMLLAPVSTAASAAITFSHPYYSFGVSVQTSNDKSGCGKIKQIAPATFGRKAGTFHGAADVSATNCKSPLVGNTAEWYSYVNLERDFKFTSTATQTVNVSFIVKAAASWNTTPFTSCTLNYNVSLSECLVTSEVEIYSYTYIFDETNFSYSMGFSTMLTNYTTTENYSQYYNCGGSTPCHSYGNFSFGNSSSFSGALTGYTNFTTAGQTIVTTDTYQVETTILVLAISEVEVQGAKAKGAGSASASVSLLQPAGDGITVRSIVIS